jgi:hypothetical protein
MRLSLLLAGLLLTASLPSSANAADAGIWRKPVAAPPATVFRVIPRSSEASLVWASDACWRGCAQQCGWQFQACLGSEPENACRQQNDGCDRFCQSHCRSYGGPLLPLGN